MAISVAWEMQGSNQQGGCSGNSSCAKAFSGDTSGAKHIDARKVLQGPADVIGQQNLGHMP